MSSSSQNKRQVRTAEEDDEVEKKHAKKQRKTATSDGWLLLDRCAYPDRSETPDGDRAHAADAAAGHTVCTASAVTSQGARFELSLRAQEPPGVTRLAFTADVPGDILSSYKPPDTGPYHFFPFRPRSAEFNLRVVASDDTAVLVETLCLGSDYFVLDRVDDDDALSPPVLTRLPGTPPRVHGGMGIMRRGGGREGEGYVVAALHQAVSPEPSWHVSFFSSSSSATAWRRREARLPAEVGGWLCWQIAAVLVCGGRFWWVDLQRGLLSCSVDSLLQQQHDDDAEQQPPLVLQFTPLPNVSMEQAKGAGYSDYPLVQDRCVAASAGRLRYVEMSVYRNIPRRAASSPPPLCDDCRGGSVTTWTLDGDTGAWAQDHALKLADVWRDESYGSTGLPRTAPEFPLVDPSDPNVVYFSMIIERGEGDGHVFGVDLSTRKVTACSGRYKGLNTGCCTLEPVFHR
ncbi:hypothetical protein EJB05_41289, partial [Eragrostis curvula]